MIAVLSFNPFGIIKQMLNTDDKSGLGLLLTLTSVFALICIFWQIIQLWNNSHDEKVVAQKKKNIIKIFTAYACVISISLLIALVASLFGKLENPKNPKHSESWINNHTYVKELEEMPY